MEDGKLWFSQLKSMIRVVSVVVPHNLGVWSAPGFSATVESIGSRILIAFVSKFMFILVKMCMNTVLGSKMKVL